MADYDITNAFKAIENELISSMIRNLDHHRAEETAEGIQWTQWQTEQLNALEQYKKHNKKKFGKQFQSINNKIATAIRAMKEKGGLEQEQSILKAISKGYKNYHLADSTVQAEFFGVNDRKLEALITATTHDIERAETAVLRLANDKYRKAIYNAQVYANAGGTTYKKAVDMAVKDMLNAGLNCVEYKNGTRHTLENYANMAIRTATTRAYLQGEGAKRKEWGISTVILNKRSCPCPKCLPFVGKVFIDDVWSGGTAEEAKEKGYPLLSTAIDQGLYHPNCKDIHTTYFEGISTPPDKPTAEEKQKAIDKYNQEQKIHYNAQQAEKCERISKYSLDDENKHVYKARAEQWREKEKSLKSVAKSGESGIINEDSNKPITKITDNAINNLKKVNITGYTDEQCVEIQKQHKELLRYSRENNNNKEVSFVFRKNLTDRVIFIGSDDKLEFGYALNGKGRDLIVLHNHPRNSSFSTTDIEFFSSNDSIKTLTIVKNNGKTEVLTKSDMFDFLTFATEYSRLYKKIVKSGTDSEKDKFVRSLLTKSKAGVRWIEN